MRMIILSIVQLIEHTVYFLSVHVVLLNGHVLYISDLIDLCFLRNLNVKDNHLFFYSWLNDLYYIRCLTLLDTAKELAKTWLVTTYFKQLVMRVNPIWIFSKSYADLLTMSQVTMRKKVHVGKKPVMGNMKRSHDEEWNTSIDEGNAGSGASSGVNDGYFESGVVVMFVVSVVVSVTAAAATSAVVVVVVVMSTSAEHGGSI